MSCRRFLALALAASVAASVTLAGCAVLPASAGTTVTRDRPIDAVTAVVLATSGHLTVTTGAKPALSITAGDRVIDQLTSEIRNGTLVLDEKPGSADADLAPSDALAVMVNGSGDLTARGVRADAITVDVAGSGTVGLTGTAGRQSVSISGSGGYAGAELGSEDAAVSISGSGDADVQVTRTLDATVSGSGSITYGGGAAVTRNLTGSGDLRER